MRQPTAIPIVLYHSLSADATEPYRPFSMDPGQFAEQMELIAAEGYTSLTMAELLTALEGPIEAMPERPIAITLDDGFEDMHSVALPILTRLSLQSTAYISTAYLGGTSRWLGSLGEGERLMLSPGQVRDLDAAGVEIGAHSHRHIALDEVRFSEAAGEIDRSLHGLQEIVDHPVATFAYPYGYHTGRIKRYLQASGFASACGVKQALSHRDDDRFALARLIVDSELSMEGFASWIRGDGLPFSWRRERLRTKAWRVVRRMKQITSASAQGDLDG